MICAPAVSDLCCVALPGVRWKAASAEEKVPYEEKAVLDKARFAGEKAAYKEKRAAAGEESDSDAPRAKKKAKKDKDAPKGVASSYILFGAAVRASIKEQSPDITPTEIMKEIGAHCIAAVEMIVSIYL